MTFLPKSLQSNGSWQIPFLLLAVLALYLPAVSGTINSIDDAGILQFYGAGHLTLADVLKPGAGYYYRPVIALSFYLDHHLFGQSPLLLHLENILIHVANTGLVFLLAKRLMPSASELIPLGAAAVFATHPVNAEAVNWIAGRTDPLAALFLLLSGLALCRGLESGKGRYTVLSVLLLLLGVLTKETAVLFVPASFLLIECWLKARPGDPAQGARGQRRALCVFYFGICLVFAAILCYRAASQNSVAKLLVAGTKLDPSASLLLCLRIAGFYLKKMVVPWPLNFAITTIDPRYLVPGLLFPVLFWLLPGKNPYRPLLLLGVLFLLPAIVVGVFDVAWTVVAERYLYIPSAFLCIGGIGYLHLAAERLQRRHLLAAVLALLVTVGAVGCLDRTRTWQSNLSLYRDTVAKTPDFGMLHNALALALIQAGRYSEAEEELNLAASLDPSDLVKGLIRKNRMALQLAGATPEETHRYLKKYGREKSREDTEILDVFRVSGNKLLVALPAGEERETLVNDLIEVDRILYQRTGDPLLLYNAGQLLMRRGDRREAADCFARSYLAAPEGAHYKLAARKLAGKLGVAL